MWGQIEREERRDVVGVEEQTKRTPVICWAEEDRIFCIASMPGGCVITGGATSGDIEFHDSRTGAKETTLTGHSESVLSLHYVPELRALFSSSADSTVRQWNMDTLQNVMVYEGHLGFVVGLCAVKLESGTGLFTGGDDRSVKQWNVHSGACVHTYRGHKGPVNTIAATETHAYSGSSDGLLKVWDHKGRRCVRTIEAHLDAIWSIVVLPDRRVLTASSDATIKVWEDLVTSTVVQSELYGHRGKIRKLLVQDPLLFSAGADTHVHVWNINTGSHLETLSLHDKPVSGLSLENNQLVSVGFDRLLVRWDVSDVLINKQPLRLYQPLNTNRTKEIEQAKSKADESAAMRAKARLRNQSTDEIVSGYKELPVNFVAEALEFKVESSRLSCELLLYIPFLIGFIFLFLLSRPVEDNYYLVNAVSTSLGTNELPSFKSTRTFQDITTEGWFDRWLDVLGTELWAHRSSDGRPVVRGQNLLLGAVRIRTQRAKPGSCTVNKEMFRDGATLGAPCYGDISAGVDEAPFACADDWRPCTATKAADLTTLGLGPEGFTYDSKKGEAFTGQLQSYKQGGHGIDLPFNTTQAEALAALRALARLDFADDRQTRLVDVQFHLYNPAVNIFLAVHNILEVPAGGSWAAVLERETGYELFTLQSSGGIVAAEVIFFCFVLVFVGLLGNEGYEEYRKKSMLGFILSWWNILEVLNLGCFFVTFIFRWQWMAKSKDYKLDQVLDRPGYPEDLHEVETLYQSVVYCTAINTILTFMKLLKYVRLNDRLNVLTRTLAAAQQHLAGVVIIFVYLVFGFALVGFLLFGGSLHTFRSLSAAYVSLLRLLLGDVDYHGMSAEGEATTFIFFWVYNALCLWVLMNFLVAVISDAFADVSRSKTTVPLDVSILKIVKDAQFECLPKTIRGKLMLLKHRRFQTSIIREALEELIRHRDEMVDADAAQRRDYDELEGHMLHKDQYVALVPTQYLDQQTEGFVDEVWRDMAWEYYYDTQASKGQEQNEREQIVQEEVLLALRHLIEAFPLLDAIQRRLGAQLTKIRPFAESIKPPAEDENLPRRKSTKKSFRRRRTNA